MKQHKIHVPATQYQHSASKKKGNFVSASVLHLSPVWKTGFEGFRRFKSNIKIKNWIHMNEMCNIGRWYWGISNTGDPFCG